MTTELNLVSTFDDQKIAGEAIEALRDEGFQDRNIKVLKGDADKLMSELSKRGFSEDDAREFADAAEEGKTLVVALVAEDRADQAVAIMDRFEALQAKDDQGADDAEIVQVVEERLEVGKSKAATGGVRVTSSVSEKPVEETVTLREERVGAKRRSADRTLDADEAEGAFEEKTVEMMGTKEEAEVRKEARVVGEVAITKEIEEREETVRDTVRATDVEIEKLGTSARKRK
jgi:stress response protein YsnF